MNICPEPAEDSRRAGAERRCLCGQLLARWTPEGLELKCKRCRRLAVIPWDGGEITVGI